MKLGTFISGVFGSMGFSLSVLAGISTGNSIESILTRGLLSACICYAVGYCVGIMAQQVSLEHAGRLSTIVAMQDKAAEDKRLQEQADQDAQMAADTAQAIPAPSPLK